MAIFASGQRGGTPRNNYGVAPRNGGKDAPSRTGRNERHGYGVRGDLWEGDAAPRVFP